MNKRKIRDIGRLTFSLLFFGLYIPHIFLYLFKNSLRKSINADLERRKEKNEVRMNKCLMFLYYIHTDRYFRNLFYHRVGAVVGAVNRLVETR